MVISEIVISKVFVSLPFPLSKNHPFFDHICTLVTIPTWGPNGYPEMTPFWGLFGTLRNLPFWVYPPE